MRYYFHQRHCKLLEHSNYFVATNHKNDGSKILDLPPSPGLTNICLFNSNKVIIGVKITKHFHNILLLHHMPTSLDESQKKFINPEALSPFKDLTTSLSSNCLSNHNAATESKEILANLGLQLSHLRNPFSDP